MDTLKAIAEKSGYKLLCDPAVLEEVLAQGNPSKRIAPTRIKHDPKITPIKPYEYGKSVLVCIEVEYRSLTYVCVYV